MSDVTESIVIGSQSVALHDRCILIGEELRSRSDYQLLVSVGGVRIDDVMSEDEWRPLYEALWHVLQRIYRESTHAGQEWIVGWTGR